MRQTTATWRRGKLHSDEYPSGCILKTTPEKVMLAGCGLIRVAASRPQIDETQSNKEMR